MEEEFYHINELLNVHKNKNTNEEFKQKLMNCCNWFDNKVLANKMANKLKILFILEAFTEKDKEIIDWTNYSQYKYYISYNAITDELFIDTATSWSPCEIFFASKKICQEIIDLIGDEIKNFYKYELEIRNNIKFEKHLNKVLNDESIPKVIPDELK